MLEPNDVEFYIDGHLEAIAQIDIGPVCTDLLKMHQYRQELQSHLRIRRGWPTSDQSIPNVNIPLALT